MDFAKRELKWETDYGRERACMAKYQALVDRSGDAFFRVPSTFGGPWARDGRGCRLYGCVRKCVCVCMCGVWW